MWRRLVLGVLLSFLVSATALADGAIVSLMSDDDRAVLERFDARREAAIVAASGAPDSRARATLAEVVAGDVRPFDEGYDPGGDGRCRYLKLGPDDALTVHGWFACRIFDDGAGWVLQKTTGSQRSRGRLYRLTDERLLYLGALHHAHEEPMAFGDDPTRNQLAVLTRVADGRLRLEFPAPLAESAFDILELAP
jgi:hypothetical protein